MLSIVKDERAALHFDELASLLEAGLPPRELGAGAAEGERAVHALLEHRGVRLSPSDDAVLAAAWKAGRIGPALRARAEQRRERAALVRGLLLGLAYPAALFGAATFAALATAPIMGHYWFVIGLVTVLAVIVVGVLIVRRGLRTGDERWNRMPVVGRIATDLAEIPYLETLQALYGAGVPIVEAHATALGAVPNAALQRRLAVAGRVLEAGQPLTEALAQSLALHPDTRMLLGNGERAGDLENALDRALQRRRDVSQRAVRTLGRTIAIAVYVLAAAVAITLIFSFYLRFYGSFRAR